MKLLKTLLPAMVVSFSALTASSAIAAQWHMPTPYGDANLPTKIAYDFAEQIKGSTGGEVDITVHSGASLMKHPEIPRAVRTGQVQLGEVFIGIMGNTHPIFKHDNIPFLATDYNQAQKLWEAAKPEIEKQLSKEGMILLYTVPWPAQSLYTKKPVNALADIKGTKMRAYSPSTSRLADLMNTTPTTVQVPDIPQAFSTGIIDAMITSPSTGANGQAWDYLSHYNEIKAWIPKNFVVVNKRAFKRLDKDDQKAILDAAEKAEARGWNEVTAQEAKDTKTLADNGIVVSQPSEQLLGELQAIGQTMTNEWEQEDPAALTPVLSAYSAK
ncbi:C4-dicarboxylate ABC transporter substrate-binding protein [Enterovibrio norvegicus]|uniref:TRAP transporter substrate-binding protein n=1 Tax=Enterovibrio norvegicus TaxID=188144 RepID=UPI000C85E83C|nr:TRAP transporter substrate-binding protein [Enterovibrio norvegicus]MCC4800055.1 TRAP transporter substrate-binding protein [Enterovibrio norvegicus]PMI27243.1 C4-dicarboxylate ABC transporter substrate-binding protein [Enterovibrio norvegicus]PMI32703.1 C4-dicarboxylate ABC transporter substrate-binding protein [Enterovibrio norvegicus]PMN52866.1 C4-dicarboxylate ABC transporter substrate-binding protein [Enterovibrio norvegicus]TKF18014.1 TRAP transporter substrate-binding protein [Entero